MGRHSVQPTSTVKAACKAAVLLLCLTTSAHLARAQTTPSSSPSNSNVLSAAAAILGNVLGVPATPSSETSPTLGTTTASSTPTPTPAATPAATSAPTPTPTATPAPTPTPQAVAPAAVPPPPPVNGNATALLAELQMQGTDLWPFTRAAANALVQALSQTLTTVTISGMNVINATQAEQPSGRKLLGANDIVSVFVELEGTSPAAALSINSDLGNSVLNGNLQKTLARNGLILQGLSLTYSNAAVPENNLACNSGSFQGSCISGSDGGLSKGAVIGIAVGAGLGALALIALCMTCILRCARKKQAGRVGRETPPKKVMTPQHAQPYWEQNQKEANRDVVSLSATPGSVAAGSATGPGSYPGTASGDQYAETREMGGRIARDQLKMKLPSFAARTGRTTSGISRTTSAVSRQTSFAGSRTASYAPGAGGEGLVTGLSEV